MKYCVSLLMLVYSLEESEVMSGFQTPLRLGCARARDVLWHACTLFCVAGANHLYMQEAFQNNVM